jgi:hypothetical protein
MAEDKDDKHHKGAVAFLTKYKEHFPDSLKVAGIEVRILCIVSYFFDECLLMTIDCECSRPLHLLSLPPTLPLRRCDALSHRLLETFAFPL